MTTNTKGQPFLYGLKNKSIVAEDKVLEIKNWLFIQLHLPSLTDEHIHLFLHSCYGNVEQTKKTIESYFTVRTHSPELFSNRDLLAPEIQKIYNIVQLAPMPELTPEGYRVLVYRLIDSDPSKVHFVTGLKLFFMFNDVQLSEDGLAEGYIVVFDMTNIGLGHLARISLSAVRKFMIYIQECHPARLKGVHVINTVGFMDKILALVKPFMKSELIQLLHLHGPVQSLERFFPQKVLPKDYGGEADEMRKLSGKQRELLETQYAKWLQEGEILIVDENKRFNKQPSRLWRLLSWGGE